MSEPDADRLLSTKEAAALLGLSPRTLEDWRWQQSNGPPYSRISRNCIRYRRTAVLDWAEARSCQSTTDAFVRGLNAPKLAPEVEEASTCGSTLALELR